MIQEIIHDIKVHGLSQLLHVLSPADLRSINSYFDHKKDQFRPALVGTSTNKQRVEDIRGDLTLWLDPLDPPPEFKKVFDVLETLKQSLNEKFYLGLKQSEAHLAYYPKGYFYKKHLDTFESGSSRRISYIFYLHEAWSEGDGGELVVYDQQGQHLKTFSPQPGSLVTFLSQDFPHEVKVCHKERRSLTGWMHNKLLY